MTPPRRRWLRFSLRTLLVSITLGACWLGWNANVVHHRRRLLEWAAQHDCAIGPRQATLEKLNALQSVGANAGDLADFSGVQDVSWIRRLMGDEAIASFEFFAPEVDYQQQLLAELEDHPAPESKYYPVPKETRAELRQWFPEALIDYAAPHMSSARSSRVDEAVDDPQRFSFPTIGPLARP